jgi:type VI secretion system protein
MRRFCGFHRCPWRARLWPVIVLASAGLLASCGLGVRTRALFGGAVDLKVQIDDNANFNSPVALDVLLVYDEDLLKQLLKMPAREWFDRRDQIKRDFPDGSGLDAWSWEWVPGQRIPVQRLPLVARAKAMVIYANYLSPGEHRARRPPHESVSLQLLERDFTVSPLK